MDSVKLYAGYGGMIDLENDKLVHDRGKFVRSSDYQALRARLGEVEKSVDLWCAAHKAAQEELTFARQELAAVLEGQEILKRQTVRIREALGAEPEEDTEEAARRVRQELAGALDAAIEIVRYEIVSEHKHTVIDRIRALKPTKETAGG